MTRRPKWPGPSLLLIALAVGVADSRAQAPSAPPPPYPAVTVSASATRALSNDHVQAWLRAEAESPNAASAASQVNGIIAKALARAKQTQGVRVATSGYSTQQITEKGKPNRWHVVQSVTVDSEDFAATANLITRLQEDDGLLLSGMNFSVSEQARRQAEEALTQQAIRSWQDRAQQASTALGYASWRTGHVTVQAGDTARPIPMLRSAAAAYASPAPVALEGGNSDVTVSVSGEALLEQPRAPAR